MKEVELNVGGMSCGHCSMAIEKSLNSLEGVNGVKVDLDSGKVKVSYDEDQVTKTDIEGIITEEGYTVN